MKKLVLYSRMECPLCEFAEQLLHNEGIVFTALDIDESDDLIKRYHVRVPVLTDGDKELDWPFNAKSAQELAHG